MRVERYGEPFTSTLALFGATQGVLSYLRFSGQTLKNASFGTPAAALFVLGGACSAGAFSVMFYGDAQLRRLHQSHVQDQSLKIESQKWSPAQ